jgi:hypothetical protein
MERMRGHTFVAIYACMAIEVAPVWPPAGSVPMSWPPIFIDLADNDDEYAAGGKP